MAYTYTLGTTYAWGSNTIMTLNVVADAATGNVTPVPAGTPVIGVYVNGLGAAPAAGPAVGYTVATGVLAFAAMSVQTYLVTLVLP